MQKTNYSAFGTLIVIFFFWGFVAASNSILIPVFKKALTLTQLQSQLIEFAFYVAYTVGSLIYFSISGVLKQDILNKIGYRNGLALGLLISAAGTLLFIPASANGGSFPLLLSGLFIVGLGFSLQQTAANPLAIQMGDPAKGNVRLSMAGGINNLGTTIGPVILSYAIFGGLPKGDSTLDLTAVQLPYIILGATFVLAALFFKFSSVPDSIGDDNQNEPGQLLSTLREPQVILAMIAIFLYVGVEVATQSNLPEFMKQNLGKEESEVAPFVSLFWASMMIGRWASAAGVFEKSKVFNRVMGIFLPLVAFGIFALANTIGGSDVSSFMPYIGLVFVLIAADFISNGNPVRQIILYSSLGILALIIGIFSSGYVSVFAFISVGLFCSTLWPCIFTLGITGMGTKTNIASSLMILMIMGGGVISVTQGWLSDNSLLGIQHSYWVGVACFAYLIYFAIRTATILKNKGIHTFDAASSGH
jgi:FHS family L-fucose permease-like MFS transporter